MIGQDSEAKSRDDSIVNVFMERADCFWKMKDATLDSIVAAARDHGELAAYFQKYWSHKIVDGGLSGCVMKLLEAYRTDHPDEVAVKPTADGAP